MALGAPAQERAPDPVEIVRRSVERDWTDFESRKNYTYQERSEFRQYAHNGSSPAASSETNEILILGEAVHMSASPRAMTGPCRPREAPRQQAKLDSELAKRQHESPADTGPLSKGTREKNGRLFGRSRTLSPSVLVETGAVSNQPAWVIEAQPKPGYRAIHSRAKDLAKVRAKIWIEQATYHWVKVDGEALDTIWSDFGLLRIARGSAMHFEQTRVNDEIWLPSSMLVRFEARLALVKMLRGEFDIRYSNYQKFQSDSKILEK